MKFFSTALAAFAVGSAIAAPTASTPCQSCTGDKTGVKVPAIGLGGSCTGTTVPVPSVSVPVDVGKDNDASEGNNAGQGNNSGHKDNSDVVVVIHHAVDVAVTVEAKVKAQLDVIGLYRPGKTPVSDIY